MLLTSKTSVDVIVVHFDILLSVVNFQMESIQLGGMSEHVGIFCFIVILVYYVARCQKSSHYKA